MNWSAIERKKETKPNLPSRRTDDFQFRWEWAAARLVARMTGYIAGVSAADIFYSQHAASFAKFGHNNVLLVSHHSAIQGPVDVKR